MVTSAAPSSSSPSCSLPLLSSSLSIQSALIFSQRFTAGSVHLTTAAHSQRSLITRVAVDTLSQSFSYHMKFIFAGRGFGIKRYQTAFASPAFVKPLLFLTRHSDIPPQPLPLHPLHQLQVLRLCAGRLGISQNVAVSTYKRGFLEAVCGEVGEKENCT